ncbi:MAG: hypothetical protein GY779_17370, partial [Gammaproteobacteria bacterium]|nr:hypothetical protein [Gammaproteobacteria bacterium]
AVNSSVSLANSTVSGNTADKGTGGGINVSNSSVSLANSTVSGNYADNGWGGGISAGNNSNMSLTNSTVSGNSAYFTGGGIDANNSSISLVNSSVSNNSATYSYNARGGGIYIYDNKLSLTNSTVSNNSAISGGGIFATGYQDTGYSSVSLINSTVSYNSADKDGGGIFAGDKSTVSLGNSTVSKNSASRGGGIYSRYYCSVSLVNSTMSNNSASTYGGGIYSQYDCNTSLVNSIISGNTGGSGAEIYNTSSTLTAAHNNLFGHSSLTLAQAFENFTPGATDINATSGDDNIALSSILSTTLADNGCQQLAGAPSSAACVQTHALVSGSPAIDGADEAVCLGTDQKGKPRKDGMMMPIKTTTGNIAVVNLGDDYCDIGSVEFSSGD